MKLTDLDPRWFSLEENGPRVGLTFNCPHCQDTRLGIMFHEQGHEKFDGVDPKAILFDKYIWTKSGNDFADLTIAPSIDASKQGHWHGFITNGEII